MSNQQDKRPRIIIIGAGFGGLHAVRILENKDVDVLIIDKRNFHTFTPLLYQVATCGLEAEEIAYPIRGIFHGKNNIRFLMGEATDIDHHKKVVSVQTEDGFRLEPYDYLIVAAGSVTNYFNLPEIANRAFELKTLNDAIKLRNHILSSVERAAWTQDETQRKMLTTIVVVGGGPTGLETAGAMHELYTHVLRKEYPFLKSETINVILVEATSTLLNAFPEDLQAAAIEQMQNLGVKILLGNPVIEAAVDYIRLKDGTIIPTSTLIWTAGVQGSPLAATLQLPLNRGGRVPIKATTEVIGIDDVFVVGDMAYLEDENQQPYPMLIPVAKQQGILSAKNILSRIQGHPEEAFQYIDRGIMATIGRSRAVAWIYNKISLKGFVAWISWLALHLVTLMGFRNRINVLVNWIWNYFTYDRSIRIILEDSSPEKSESQC